MVAATEARTPLSRRRILQAALDYVDQHGLAALSMHKLGAELGVKGMSLYNHVKSKDRLLDGIVEAMWAEVELPDEAAPSWQHDVRSFAQSLRHMVHRHPQAAPLLLSRPVMPIQALEFFNSYLRRLQDGGLVPLERALELVRTVTAYAFGFALAELAWMESSEPSPQIDDGLRSFRHVSGIVPTDAPDYLIRTAMVLCTRCDMDAQFGFGIDLMLRGLDAEGPPAAAPD